MNMKINLKGHLTTGGCDGKTRNRKHLYPIFQVYGWTKSSWTYEFKKIFHSGEKIEDLFFGDLYFENKKYTPPHIMYSIFLLDAEITCTN